MELLRKPVQKSHELGAGAGGIRQPVDGDACKRSDAHDAGLEPVHPADLALQRLLLRENFPHKRQQLRPLRGQENAALAALQKRHAPLALQIGDHFADRGLRVAKRLRRAGKAAGLDGFDKGEVFEQLIVYAIFIPFPDIKYR